MLEKNMLLKRWLWGLGALTIFLVLVWRLQNLATLALLAFIVAYVLSPVVSRLERLRFLNRAAATLITIAALSLCILAFLFILIPSVFDEFQVFAKRLPELVQKFKTEVLPLLERYVATPLPHSLGDVLSQFGQDINELVPKMLAPATRAAAMIFGGTFSIVFAVLSLFMFPLFLFFLLKDFPRIVSAVDGLIPLASKPLVHHLAKAVDASLSNFLHGQFMVMLVLGTLFSIGFSIVGVPVAIGVGILIGTLCFIPYVGAAVGFALAILLTLLDFTSWSRVAGVCGVFVFVQVLDATVITPRILGGKLGLRPLWIIVALMAGAELFGFLGVLLAVPATAVLKVLVAHTVERYRQSMLYLSPPEHSDSWYEQQHSEGEDIPPPLSETPAK